MACIDYGAILKVNNTIYKARDCKPSEKKKYKTGECDLFMDRSESGYIINEAYNKKNKTMYDISGHYYVYAGDQTLMLAFYKFQVVIISGDLIIEDIDSTTITQNKYEIKLSNNETVKLLIQLIDPNHWGKYIAKWDYNKKHYEVIYGFGIEGDTNIYNIIKNGRYNYSKAEIDFIDKWNQKAKVKYMYAAETVDTIIKEEC